MIPILYDKQEKDFTSLGLGVLADAIDCIVREERNGIFELIMQYPKDTALFNLLKDENQIVADASPELKEQIFIIDRVTKPENGVATIYASHISQYKTVNDVIVNGTAYNGNAQAALEAWNNGLVSGRRFEVSSNIGFESSGVWNINSVENARKALGGTAGSILDIYGGEYRFDNNKIQLLKQRGRDSKVLIAYGKNITNFIQDEVITNTVTSIYPFATVNENTADGDIDTKILELPEKVLHSENASKFAHTKVRSVDLSGEGVTDEATLRSRALTFMKANNIGVPDLNLSVSFVDLANSLNYSEQALSEIINLCDLVYIDIEDYDIWHSKAKITTVIYDVLLDMYQSIEIGNTTNLFNKVIGSVELNKVNDYEKQKKREQSLIERFRDIASELIKDTNGSHVRVYDDRILFMDSPDEETAIEVLQINKNGIGFSQSGVDGPYSYAWTLDGKFNTDFIAAGTIMVNHLHSDVGARLDLSSNESISLQVKKYFENNIDEIQGSVNFIRYKKILAYGGAILDTSDYLETGTIGVVNSSQVMSGVGFKIDEVLPNTTYSLAFDIVVTNGTLVNFSGTTGSSFSKNRVYIDGILQSSYLATPKAVDKDCSIVIVFDTPEVVNNDDSIYIMLNKNLTTSVQYNLLKARMHLGEIPPNTWTKHPLDPIKQAIFEVTHDGWITDDESTDVMMTGSSNGIQVVDKNTSSIVFQATNEGVEAQKVIADQMFASNVANKFRGWVDLYVDGVTESSGNFSGKDWANAARSIQEVLDKTLKGATVLDNAIITIHIRASVAEDVDLRGYTGLGKFVFRGYSENSKLVGALRAEDCTVPVEVDTLIVQKIVNDRIGLSFVNSNGYVKNVKVDGAGGVGIGADRNGSVTVENSIVANSTHAIYAQNNGSVALKDVEGGYNQNAIVVTTGGRVSATGKHPLGVVQELDGWVKLFNSTATTNPFKLVAAGYKTVSRTFTAFLTRINQESGYKQEYSFAQGKRKGYSERYRGYAAFGSQIKNWLESNGGYQALQAPRLEAVRAGWGYGNVALKISNYNISMPAQARYTTVSSLISDANFKNALLSDNLILSTSTLNESDYANFIRISITVTADKLG